ncbi:hypothetical protein SRABI106_04861 [Rahnella aquatilis]|nr:hypothetical protein SRABI106_04861 [Rahnella aquatilis]
MSGIALRQVEYRPGFIKLTLSIFARQTLKRRAAAIGIFHVAGVNQRQLAVVCYG